MNPYTIIGALLLLIATALGGAHIGKKLERQEWQNKKIVSLEKYNADLATEFNRYDRMVKFNEAQARKASADYAKALAAQEATHDEVVARKRAAGGLRIDRATCATKDAATTEGPSASRPDGSGSRASLFPESADRHLPEEVATIRLPTDVENDLFDLAEDADKLATQLRMLQKWVKDNGHYGQEQN